MTVDGGDDRGGLARNVDQDRGGRAAVLRAVIDAREQDERGDRRQRERDRQQHRDRGDRADTGQDSNQRAKEHAGEAIGDVLERERDPETEREIGEDVHPPLLECRPDRQGQAQCVDEDADREGGEHQRQGGHLKRARFTTCERCHGRCRNQRDQKPEPLDRKPEQADAERDDERAEGGEAGRSSRPRSRVSAPPG